MKTIYFWQIVMVYLLAILLLWTVQSNAEELVPSEPATIYYTTNGAEVSTNIVDYILSQNPDCTEAQRTYTDWYSKLQVSAGCKDNKRWRPFVCPDGRKGVIIESIPECY